MTKIFLSLSYGSAFFLLLSLSSLASTTDGQEIGTEICACTPITYEFTLDLSLTCPPVNVTIGNAIEATSCLTSPYGMANADDLVPVSVSRINMLELGQNLMVVQQTTIEDDFSDGDTINYSSITAIPDDVASASDVPKALQINLEGMNALGDKIINVFIISFSNGCGTYPVFEEGQSAGWLRFTKFGPAFNELCPASATEAVFDTTMSPSVSPIADSPSSSATPTDETPPAPTPVPKPTEDDAPKPTDDPTVSPVPAPVDDPTAAPIIASDSISAYLVVAPSDDSTATPIPSPAPTTDDDPMQKPSDSTAADGDDDPTAAPIIASDSTSAPSVVAPSDDTTATTSPPPASTTDDDSIQKQSDSTTADGDDDPIADNDADLSTTTTSASLDEEYFSMSMSMSIMSMSMAMMSLDDVVRRLDYAMFPPTTVSEFGRARNNPLRSNGNTRMTTTTNTKSNIRRRRI